LYAVPTKREQSYQKKKSSITRVHFLELVSLFAEITKLHFAEDIHVFIERPFYNPNGLKATVSAMRCLEAVLIAVEMRNWRYEYVDSKQWQRELLPAGIKGTTDLKRASRDIGTRLFPHLAEGIRKQKDADGLLIAEWARRNNR
jgi:hypothetical protein